MVTLKEILECIKRDNIIDIEIEDYYGNTIGHLKDFSIADVDLVDDKPILRLQLDDEESV